MAESRRLTYYERHIDETVHIGTCGKCGAETLVAYVLDKGYPIYWTKRGGTICFCKKCLPLYDDAVIPTQFKGENVK